MFHFDDFLIAFLATACLIFFLKPRAVHIGLVDTPTARKQHAGEVPLIGGIAMFCGFIFSCLAIDLSFQELKPYFAACLIIVIVGVMDDFRELSPITRFIAQILAALIMCFWGEVVLYDLGGLWFDGSIVNLGWLAIPFTVFAFVGVVNAVNMSDGIDGLSASLVLVAIIGLATVAFVADKMRDFNTLMLLSCTVMAFLCAGVPSFLVCGWYRLDLMIFIGT